MGNTDVLTNANPKPTTKGRRAERAPVQARARFREPGFNPFDVELYDLSSTGFR
ncbi:MAG: PilZ domain-containing protein, partial [Sphingopyxis sp.]|nr:PilZ domain-containing protein [Sphingopyxis sp.]